MSALNQPDAISVAGRDIPPTLFGENGPPIEEARAIIEVRAS